MSTCTHAQKRVIFLGFPRLIKDSILVGSNCTKYCEGSEEIIHLLIRKGANVNSVDKNGHTALDAAFAVSESEGKFE